MKKSNIKNVEKINDFEVSYIIISILLGFMAILLTGILLLLLF
jgi:hypothetical protein